MLKRFAHWASSNARIYDLIQRLVGVKLVHGRLRRRISEGNSQSLVVDVGGGTGLLRELWPRTSEYICLDVDHTKLLGCARRHPLDACVLGDGRKMPFASRSVDAVSLVFVAHHLSDLDLVNVVRESARVLKATGTLIFAEPVWQPRRLIGRLLWKYDRGEFPRTAEDLRAAIGVAFSIVHWDRFAILHEYALCVARTRTQDRI